MNPSFSLNTSWNIIKAMIDPETSQKISFLKKSSFKELQENIPIDQIEEKYGGTLPNVTKYWPPANTLKGKPIGPIQNLEGSGLLGSLLDLQSNTIYYDFDSAHNTIVIQNPDKSFNSFAYPIEVNNNGYSNNNNILDDSVLSNSSKSRFRPEKSNFGRNVVDIEGNNDEDAKTENKGYPGRLNENYKKTFNGEIAERHSETQGGEEVYYGSSPPARHSKLNNRAYAQYSESPGKLNESGVIFEDQKQSIKSSFACGFCKAKDGRKSERPEENDDCNIF